ncbi:type III secretion system cytoplasmic ring protein SctQ [Carnimonas bestiolae]|uniref:type III secretion system cytoplasmic ring protein SctQ n=1 Tax=Carnimonas bestiolae TaxID=3402172 RepID=UPI003EDC5B9E
MVNFAHPTSNAPSQPRLPRLSEPTAAMANRLFCRRSPKALETGETTLELTSIAPSEEDVILDQQHALELSVGTTRLRLGFSQATLEALLPHSVELAALEHPLQPALWFEYALLPLLTKWEDALGAPIRLAPPSSRSIEPDWLCAQLSATINGAPHTLGIATSPDPTGPVATLLSDGWPSTLQRNPAIPLSLSVVLGNQRLSLRELASLQAGDAVIIEGDLARLRLFIDKLPVGHARRQPDHTVVVEQSLAPAPHMSLRSSRFMSDPLSSEHSGDEVNTFDDIPIELQAELARIDLTLAELGQLSAGSLLPIDRAPDASITLRANGRAIGTGRLVQLGDALAIQITRINHDG